MSGTHGRQQCIFTIEPMGCYKDPKSVGDEQFKSAIWMCMCNITETETCPSGMEGCPDNSVHPRVFIGQEISWIAFASTAAGRRSSQFNPLVLASSVFPRILGVLFLLVRQAISPRGRLQVGLLTACALNKDPSGDNCDSKDDGSTIQIQGSPHGFPGLFHCPL